MKKLLALSLALVMVLAFASCKNDDSPSAENQNDTSSSTQETDLSVAQKLNNAFQEYAKDDSLSAEALAGMLSENEVVQTMGGMVTPVQEGLLMGFDNYEVKGFSEGAVFAPMINVTPFICYVFKLSQDSDVDAFKTALKENGNLRWNVCTSADEMLVESVGNTVLFIMAPTSFQYEAEDEAIGEDIPIGIDGPAAAPLEPNAVPVA